MALFSSAFLKLNRARQIIDELDKMLTEHIERNPPESELLPPQAADDGGPNWVVGKIALPFAPPESAALVGDIIHNMRTSLDHMASELARLNDKSDKNVYFPFAENAGELEEQIKRRKFTYCGSDAVALLRTFKPYRHGNEALRSIHDLDILDKHRSLIPHATIKIGRMQLFEPYGPVFYGKDGRMGRNIQWVKPMLTDLEFVFERTEIIGSGTSAIQTLKDLVGLCESILEAFAALKSCDDSRGDRDGDVATETQTHEVFYVRERHTPPDFVPRRG